MQPNGRKLTRNINKITFNFIGKSDISNNHIFTFKVMLIPKIYVLSAPNDSNETHTFMCLGRAGRFGQH